MLLKLFVLFVVVPLIELAILVELSRRTSFSVTLLVVIATGFVGTLLARSQGWKTFYRIQLELNQGKLPTDAILDAAMIFCAGALLLTPGLLTDALGMSLLVPGGRRWYRQRLFAWFRRNFQIQQFGSVAPDERSQIIDSYIVKSPTTDDRSPQDTKRSPP